MSVKAIENWANIQGRIVQIEPHEELSDYKTAEVEVSQVTPEAGYPNLFSWATGQRISLNIPKATAEALSLGTGDRIHSRVRKSGPTSSFVDPDSLTKRD